MLSPYHSERVALLQSRAMAMRIEEGGESEGQAVMAWIRVVILLDAKAG